MVKSQQREDALALAAALPREVAKTHSGEHHQLVSASCAVVDALNWTSADP